MVNVERSLESLACAIWKLERRIEILEGARPQAESDSTACFGAGRPEVEQEPLGVSGPGEIISKLKTFMEEESAAEIDPYTSRMYAKGYRRAFKMTLQYLNELTGAEPQDAA